jgi:malonyl-CoA/methylmalonyl-CoA synthetase
MPAPSHPQTLVELYERGRPASDDKWFLQSPSGSRSSYGDLDLFVSRVRALLSSLNIKKGDRIFVSAEKSSECLSFCVACFRLGIVLVPANPNYTEYEIEYLIDNCDPALVVCAPSRVDLARDRQVLTLETDGSGTLHDALSASDYRAGREAIEPSDVAAIVYTSGTTGRPKGAMLTHENLATNAATLAQLWAMRPGDVTIHALPIYHVHGLFVAVNTALAVGASLRFLSRFEPHSVLDEFANATVFMGVPTHYVRLLELDELCPTRCTNMRLFVSGSAPLLKATHEQFAKRSGHLILERYGMTELSMVASNPLDGPRKPGTVGLPLPGVEVRIHADEPEIIGEIEVRGPNVLAGYWKRPPLAPPDLTPDGYFCTGDLGRFDEDGYLSIVGRQKDLIISGGLNVYPGEVESIFDAIAGIRETAVVGVPDPDFGEVCIAVVVADGDLAISETALFEQARKKLAGFKVPKHVVFVDELPRNSMGKVEKVALRTEFGSIRSPRS